MRTIIFQHDTAEGLSDQINEWLKNRQNNPATIHSIHYAQSQSRTEAFGTVKSYSCLMFIEG